MDSVTPELDWLVTTRWYGLWHIPNLGVLKIDQHIGDVLDNTLEWSILCIGFAEQVSWVTHICASSVSLDSSAPTAVPIEGHVAGTICRGCLARRSNQGVG